jgi:hypothetical protein
MPGGNPEKIKNKGFDKHPENINKNGRPKGQSLITILKNILEKEAPDSVTNNEYIQSYIESNLVKRKLTHQETIMLKLIHSAEVMGDMAAMKEILNRIEGPITEKIEQTINIPQLPPVKIVRRNRNTTK